MPLLLDPDDIPAVGFGAYRALKVSRRTFTRVRRSPEKPKLQRPFPVPGK